MNKYIATILKTEQLTGYVFLTCNMVDPKGNGTQVTFTLPADSYALTNGNLAVGKKFTCTFDCSSQKQTIINFAF